jgi:hypothetical protein
MTWTRETRLGCLGETTVSSSPVVVGGAIAAVSDSGAHTRSTAVNCAPEDPGQCSIFARSR